MNLYTDFWEDAKSAINVEGKENSTAQPLGPPPRPQNSADGADYFNQAHSATSNPAYQAEPNPFEAQFGGSGETPGKLLPPVAALTSPSSLLPTDTPGWNSLRSGPLSPAMLPGPTGDYFDSGYSRSFPTPNESGLRTGLTPGGGGSMFPAPSPNTQNIFNNLANISTPNTLDFYKTARAATNGLAPTSQPTDVPTTQGIELKLPSNQSAENYTNHDAEAANSLFMLTQSNGTRPGNQFAIAPHSSGAVQPPVLAEATTPQTRSQKNSLGSTIQADDTSDSDDSEEIMKPTTRSRGRKQAETKGSTRRKATDSASKTPSNKRQKANAHERMDSMSDASPSTTKDGKKMTDEEKRKNFLERNR
jgi:ATF/CREB family transcription factor